MTPLTALELDALLALHRLWASPLWDALARALDWLGDMGRIYILLALLLLCFRRTRPWGFVLAAALALDALAVNAILKPLVGRIRPFELHGGIHLIIPPPGEYSFPSGHTAVAFAAALALRPLGRVPFGAALAFAVLMGLSRLYLMVHYPTDVLAGAVMGGLCGALCVWGFKKAKIYDILKVQEKRED